MSESASQKYLKLTLYVYVMAGIQYFVFFIAFTLTARQTNLNPILSNVPNFPLSLR